MAKPGGKLPGNYPYGGEKSTNGEQALRIPITHLEDPQFGETLRQLVGKLEALPEHIDLLVESGLLSASAPTFSYVCRRVPMLKRWRTFTVLAGSFPPDLIAFKKPGQSEIPREEWTRWISETQQVPALPRRPTFGDYTIQHPSYQEPIEGANPTASIRYACDTYWIIMRRRYGKGEGHAQYPANAELLCARKEFAGAHYSAGDEYIWNIGSHKQPGPGTPETWLRAGINRHMVLTARQVPGPVAMTA